MVEEVSIECFEIFRKAFRSWVSSDSVNSRRNWASEDGFDGDSAEGERSLRLLLRVDMVMMEFGFWIWVITGI